jgi:hypothetical protein
LRMAESVISWLKCYNRENSEWKMRR